MRKITLKEQVEVDVWDGMQARHRVTVNEEQIVETPEQKQTVSNRPT